MSTYEHNVLLLTDLGTRNVVQYYEYMGKYVPVDQLSRILVKSD